MLFFIYNVLMTIRKGKALEAAAVAVPSPAAVRRLRETTMAGEIYKKPMVLAVMATVTILIGSIVTMAYPMLRADMHPKLDDLMPLPALQLAGRDVYQREGCVNCHTQTVRPLPSEVARYSATSEPVAARFSLAGEFAYDHPFLWGSKRTGPDLAREGGLKPAKAWQDQHFADPQAMVPQSNMPAYAVPGQGGASTRARSRPTCGRCARWASPTPTPTSRASGAAVEGKNELDGLVAYMLSLGHAVDRARRPRWRGRSGGGQPVAGDKAAIHKGKELFEEKCAACHGDEAEGTDRVAPSLVDDVFLGGAGRPARRRLRRHHQGRQRRQEGARPARPGRRRHAGLLRRALRRRRLVHRRLAPRDRRRTRRARASTTSKGAKMSEPKSQELDLTPVEGDKPMPVGWLALFWGLIAFGAYYLWAYSPAFTGWTQAEATGGRRDQRRQHLHHHPLHGAGGDRGRLHPLRPVAEEGVGEVEPRHRLPRLRPRPLCRPWLA